ncbi:MAG TPA: hypothetical protein DCS93_44595 [Microscillaceae bacterium]|nr:hypothetical protein [Microscillaceae bacterium]
MQNYLLPLETGKVYHIYNRGINGSNIFFEERNYGYFLEKYAQYVGDWVDTFAYCLLKNHFHLLIRVKDLPDTDQESTHLKGLHSSNNFLSKHFSDLFNAYTKAINKARQRTGGLFETPFKRILVKDEAYFSRLIGYIHHNPQKHGFVNDYRDYTHSSYHSHLSLRNTKLSRDEVLGWFGNRAAYADFHDSLYNEQGLSDLIIELD